MAAGALARGFQQGGGAHEGLLACENADSGRAAHVCEAHVCEAHVCVVCGHAAAVESAVAATAVATALVTAAVPMAAATVVVSTAAEAQAVDSGAHEAASAEFLEESLDFVAVVARVVAPLAVTVEVAVMVGMRRISRRSHDSRRPRRMC